MIRLISPLSRLQIRVIEVQTKQTVNNASVTLYHKDRARLFYRRGAAEPDGSIAVLIPPSIPISLTIEAPEYKTWRYTSSDTIDQGTIQIPPNSLKELIIELQRHHRKNRAGEVYYSRGATPALNASRRHRKNR